MNYEAIASAIKSRQLPVGQMDGTYNNSFLDGGNYQYLQIVLAIAEAFQSQDKSFNRDKFIEECAAYRDNNFR